MGAGNSGVDLLGVDNFRLFGLLVKDSVVQRFALVEDRQVVMPIQADSDSGVAQGIGWTFRLDLIDYLVKLDGQVLSRRTSGRCERVRVSCQVRI